MKNKRLRKSSPTATDVLYLLMLHIDGNVEKNFQFFIICKNQENQLWKIKAAKKILKSSPTATDVLYLIMLNIDGNVDKKFQLSIIYGSREIFSQNVSGIRTFQIIEWLRYQKYNFLLKTHHHPPPLQFNSETKNTISYVCLLFNSCY